MNRTETCSRRDFLVGAAAVTAAGLLVPAIAGAEPRRSPKPAKPPAKRPNILHVMADDLGFGQLGYEGNSVVKTPRLDALSSQCLRLTRCYAAHSLCAPSRTALMTGRNAYRVGGRGGLDGVLSPQETILTKALHDQGYRTGHFGKWHQWAKPNDPQFGLDEYLYNGNNTQHVDPTYEGDCDGKTTRKPGKLTGDDSEIIARRCLEFIDRSAGKPFYANCWFHVPHDPWGSAQRFRDLYPGNPKADFLSDISAFDAAVGLLLDELAKRTLDQDTLLVVTSDNGLGKAVDEKIRIRTSDRTDKIVVADKAGMGEGAVRVPGLVRWPACFTKPATIDVPIFGCDWMPTYLAAAGATQVKARPWDGQDMLPALAGTLRERPPIAFWDRTNETDPGTLYLVSGDLRLWRGADGAQYLYRIDATNLMTPVKDAALEKTLGEQLTAWRESVVRDGTAARAESAAATGAGRRN